jgi:hypothetical protein
MPLPSYHEPRPVKRLDNCGKPAVQACGLKDRPEESGFCSQQPPPPKEAFRPAGKGHSCSTPELLLPSVFLHAQAQPPAGMHMPADCPFQNMHNDITLMGKNMILGQGGA